MPVRKCPNGKWSIGGPCVYKTKASADRAYAAYLAKQDAAPKSKTRKTK